MSYPHFFLLLAIPILQLFSCFSRFTPIWRAIFMFSAAFPALIRLSSSLNAISSTQCRLFSIPQCALSLFPYFCGCHSFPAVYGVIYSCYGIPFFRYCRYTCPNTCKALPLWMPLPEPFNIIFNVILPLFYPPVLLT